MEQADIPPFREAWVSLKQEMKSYCRRPALSLDEEAHLCASALKIEEVLANFSQTTFNALDWAQQSPSDQPNWVTQAFANAELLDDESYFKASLLFLWIEAERQLTLPSHERTYLQAQQILDKLNTKIPPNSGTIDWSNFLYADFMAWFIKWLIQIFPKLELSELVEKTSKPEDFILALQDLIWEYPQSTALTQIHSDFTRYNVTGFPKIDQSRKINLLNTVLYNVGSPVEVMITEGKRCSDG